MDAPDSFIDDGGDWQMIEQFHKRSPDTSIVKLRHTLVVKAIRLRHCSTLMIST